MLKTRSFYQERLGTNIGKAEKKENEAFWFVQATRRRQRRSSPNSERLLWMSVATGVFSLTPTASGS
jgi:hypothetical protein